MACLPIRFWIGVMIFLTTYVNYSTRVNMSVSIVSMARSKKPVPECLAKDATEKPTEAPAADGNATAEATTTAAPDQPDYGERYDWDQMIQGLILGSYFWGYVPASLPGGVIAEWIGPFHTIFWTHIITAVMNYLSVIFARMHYGLLILTRFVIGACGGLVYPALQVLIAKWAPPAEKGKFVGALMGNTLGTCVTWPLVGTITQALGWSWGFYVISIQMGVFCIIFWFVAADAPEKHRWISDKEKDYILEAQGGSVSKKKGKPPYGAMILSFPLWILTICHFGNLWGLYLQLTGVPKYLAEVIGFNLKSSGGLGALPQLMRLFFGMAFGAIGDFLKQKEIVGNKFIRKFFITFSHIIPGVLLIVIGFVGCRGYVIVALLTFSMAVNGAAVLTNLVNPQDLAPNFAGTIFGFISFVGGITGFITPALTAWLIKKNNGVWEWGWNFLIGGLVYIGCGVVFILFSSVERQSWNDIAE